MDYIAARARICTELPNFSSVPHVFLPQHPYQKVWPIRQDFQPEQPTYTVKFRHNPPELCLHESSLPSDPRPSMNAPLLSNTSHEFFPMPGQMPLQMSIEVSQVSDCSTSVHHTPVSAASPESVASTPVFKTLKSRSRLRADAPQYIPKSHQKVHQKSLNSRNGAELLNSQTGSQIHEFATAQSYDSEQMDFTPMNQNEMGSHCCHHNVCPYMAPQQMYYQHPPQQYYPPNVVMQNVAPRVENYK